MQLQQQGTGNATAMHDATACPGNPDPMHQSVMLRAKVYLQAVYLWVRLLGSVVE